tara:strand:+ start:62 stop:244 length:183 start_codon:yes stop_codon:yes gene_type:complete
MNIKKTSIVKKECEHCLGNGHIIFTTKGSAITSDLFGIKEDQVDCEYCEGEGYHEHHYTN